jgi:hypothetical protein
MKFVIVCSLAIFSLALAALAQTEVRTGVFSSGLGSVGAVAFAGGGFPGSAVAGAPYSAEQIIDHVQTLADGTRITRPPERAMFYRDSQGRTRIERTFALPPGVRENAVVRPALIEINDTISGAHYTLDERRHTASKFSFPTSLPHDAATRPMKLLALAPGPPALSAQASAPIILPREAQTQEPQISHESLGTQTIEGVVAEGTRTTMVYPVGAVGNDRPITIVHETWSSPELKTIVLSKDSDPRNGESTMRLTNISRAEPDPTLFQVPPDYQIIEPQAVSSNR